MERHTSVGRGGSPRPQRPRTRVRGQTAEGVALQSEDVVCLPEMACQPPLWHHTLVLERGQECAQAMWDRSTTNQAVSPCVAEESCRGPDYGGLHTLGRHPAVWMKDRPAGALLDVVVIESSYHRQVLRLRPRDDCLPRRVCACLLARSKGHV